MQIKQIDLSQAKEEFLRELDDAGGSPATTSLYKRSFAFLQREGITLEDFNSQHFFTRLETIAPNTWGKKTRTAHLTRIASFSNWLFRRGLTELRHQAPKQSRRPKHRQLPTDEEMSLILIALSERTQNATEGRRRTRAQDELITRLLIETGARISEVLSLTVDNLISDEHGARVVIEGTKTEASYRAVQITSELATELYSYRIQHHIARGRFFRSKTRKPLAPNEFCRWLKSFCRELGIKCPVTPHVFRHRWILEQIKAGKSALEVMTRVGHEDITMTVYYFNQVRRLAPWVELSGDIALLEKQRKFWRNKK